MKNIYTKAKFKELLSANIGAEYFSQTTKRQRISAPKMGFYILTLKAF
jgi:hypothetical protein